MHRQRKGRGEKPASARSAKAKSNDSGRCSGTPKGEARTEGHQEPFLTCLRQCGLYPLQGFKKETDDQVDRVKKDHSAAVSRARVKRRLHPGDQGGFFRGRQVSGSRSRTRW